jgi:hypothetical protein
MMGSSSHPTDNRNSDPNGDPNGDRRSFNRAALALSCLPFRRSFYIQLVSEALSSQALESQPQLCWQPRSAESIENDFLWLIWLGVLRREVDGQGLTERVRLTPMGRKLLDRWPGELPRAGALARLFQGLRRRWPRL